MTDYTELKKFAEIAKESHGKSSLSKSLQVTDFYSRATPEVVLALISQIQSLKGSCKALGEKTIRRKMQQLDRLKVENEALRSMLVEIRDCGAWFHTALELNSSNGKELEAKIESLVGRDDEA